MKKVSKFQEFLRLRGACQEGADFVGNMTAREAWRKCEEPSWKAWLLRRIAGELGMHGPNHFLGSSCPGCRFANQARPRFPAKELGKLGIE